ncbi:hypothetical protein HP439_01330 [Sphingobacterium shayense]|uniref:putative Ig domain-containing protein n=1 Tax=Sphingobacterium shayense TaxID=626343 RepID=UPI001553ACCF|nr:putative Ig domain-containing protein [Sphingobacterium shayense]NQD69364.1 hypothetical protein [Sphingobacterium shayense]
MKKILLLFLSVIFISSCVSSAGSVDYFGQAYPDTIPVVFAPDIISQKGRLEHGVSFAPDGQELAFGILRKGDLRGEIFYSQKANEKWSNPLVFEPLKNKSVYLPYFSPNGRFLLYAQSKTDTDHADTDIWMIEKTNDAWSLPKLLHGPILSEGREANASMSYDGTIYFSSNRNCDGRENCHTADLFYSELKNNRYQAVNIIPELASSNDEESVFISPKEEYLIFCRYTDEQATVDLYISYRDTHNNWLEPQRVNSPINSKDWERRPFVTLDNNFLFFTRLQIGENQVIESDIFWVNTSKLFKPFIFHPISNNTAHVGTAFEISLPQDYFRDIDDEKLTYTINQNQPDWLNFDAEQMKLSGIPTVEGEFELILTATDNSSNRTDSKIRITVKE